VLYFFILPAFLLALIFMFFVTLAARFVEVLNPAYPFAWRVLLWSSIGFMLVNALWLLLVIFGATPGGQASEQQTSNLVKFGYAALLFVGPVILSAIGFLGGSVLGVWFAFKATRALTLNVRRPA